MKKVAIFLTQSAEKWTPEKKALNKACNDLYYKCNSIRTMINWNNKQSRKSAIEKNEEINEIIDNFPDLQHRKKLQKLKLKTIGTVSEKFDKKLIDDFKAIQDYLVEEVTFRKSGNIIK